MKSSSPLGLSLKMDEKVDDLLLFWCLPPASTLQLKSSFSFPLFRFEGLCDNDDFPTNTLPQCCPLCYLLWCKFLTFDCFVKHFFSSLKKFILLSSIYFNSWKVIVFIPVIRSVDLNVFADIFFFFHCKTFVSAAFWGSLIPILIFILWICLHACIHFPVTTELRLWFSEGASSQVHLSSLLNRMLHSMLMPVEHKKNLSLHHSSSRQRWFKQTSVFYDMLLESFSVLFFFIFFFYKTPGCCLQPSGRSPTQSRFVKCRTDCCLSRKFSCSSQGNAVVQLDRSLDLSHLHCRGPLLPVAWFVVRHATLGRQLHSAPTSIFTWSPKHFSRE